MTLTAASRFECDRWFMSVLRNKLDISSERVSYKGEGLELFVVYRNPLKFSKKKGANMQNCPRCLNLGIVPDILNPGREGDGPSTPAIRCIICGFFADKLIMARWLSYREQAVTVADSTTWTGCIKGDVG